MNVSYVWFRRDLRLSDNEAVFRSAQSHDACVYLFIIDPWFFEQPETGLLRIRFLFESLAALDTALQTYGNQLVVLKGKSIDVLTALLENSVAAGDKPTLYFNHDIQYEYGRERDQAVEAYCQAHDIPLVMTHGYFLLHDETAMDDWWRQYYDYQYAPQYDVPAITPLRKDSLKALDDTQRLRPHHLADDMSLKMPSAQNQLFHGGEQQARMAVYTFLKDHIAGYHWKISQPYLVQRGATSLLGPHLAYGTISSRTVFQAARHHQDKLEKVQPKKAFDIKAYLDRLRWRDSFTQRLWFHPELLWQNRFPEFDDVYNQAPLRQQQQAYFDAWKAGTTGFPLLDAAMRQLKHDGFMTFRMRAMAATFLTINCGVSWHHGARHFMQCLVDGDIAINHWQWQMQAGVTNPLSPTFRMYNPTKNFRDRDSDARYVHYWLPETRGKNVETIIKESSPMLDFLQTRRDNGKIIADLRKVVRERIMKEKGISNN